MRQRFGRVVIERGHQRAVSVSEQILEFQLGAMVLRVDLESQRLLLAIAQDCYLHGLVLI